jgi:hypothetical protein
MLNHLSDLTVYAILGGPQKQSRLVFDCIEIPVQHRHKPSIPRTLPKTNASRDVPKRNSNVVHSRPDLSELINSDAEDTEASYSTDSAHSWNAEALAAKGAKYSSLSFLSHYLLCSLPIERGATSISPLSFGLNFCPIQESLRVF